MAVVATAVEGDMVEGEEDMAAGAAAMGGGVEEEVDTGEGAVAMEDGVAGDMVAEEDETGGTGETVGRAHLGNTTTIALVLIWKTLLVHCINYPVATYMYVLSQP